MLQKDTKTKKRLKKCVRRVGRIRNAINHSVEFVSQVFGFMSPRKNTKNSKSAASAAMATKPHNFGQTKLLPLAVDTQSALEQSISVRRTG